MDKGCFCHFNGYEVKDAYAREQLEALKKQTPAATITGEKDPTVFAWAKKEIFSETDLVDTANRNSFVEIDGIRYYRYHASSESFEWVNPVQEKGALTITARGVAQYGDTGTTKLCIFYDDGTRGPELYIVSGGASKTAVATTDSNKTVSKITGNYDLENWVLLDMSVMSIQANYNRGLPVANENTSGGIKADPATTADTIPARIRNGRLFVAGASAEQISESVNAYLSEHGISYENSNFTFYAEIDSDGTMNCYEITEDENGNPLSLNEIVMVIKAETGTSYMATWINGKRLAYRHNLSAGFKEMSILTARGNSLIGLFVRSDQDGMSGMNFGVSAGGFEPDVLEDGKIKKIKIGHGLSDNLGKGKIIIYGK